MDRELMFECVFYCGTCDSECAIKGASFNRADDLILKGWCPVCMTEKVLSIPREERDRMREDVSQQTEMMLLADYAPAQ